MAGELQRSEIDDAGKASLTTRRGFVTGLGFGVLSLYGVWAAYGAAPTSLAAILGGEPGGEVMGMAAMPGMGGGFGISPEEFRRLTEAFIEANELPDGSVKPARNAMAGMSKAPGDEETLEAAAAAAKGEHQEEQQAVEVYLMAQRYYYEPSLLRLEPNVPYKFRMMALDTTHGASILGSIGLGGHIMRSPAGALAEMTMTFIRPGEHLVYCTVYCGEGHGMMTGRIIVA
ncbi:MAG: hypothetical protein IIA73_02400 [Proteobacteria bacterium]|nr:hypothetical protein [Pseudomonadota bacterium]